MTSLTTRLPVGAAHFREEPEGIRGQHCGPHSDLPEQTGVSAVWGPLGVLRPLHDPCPLTCSCSGQGWWLWGWAHLSRGSRCRDGMGLGPGPPPWPPDTPTPPHRSSRRPLPAVLASLGLGAMGLKPWTTAPWKALALRGPDQRQPEGLGSRTGTWACLKEGPGKM